MVVSLAERLADSSKEHLCCLSPEREAETRQASTELGFRIWKVRLPKTFSPETIIESFGEALNFPASYGRNWNSLIDCLRYLPESKGHIILVESIDSLWGQDPTLYYKLTHILKDLGEESHAWKDSRVSFKTLLLTESPELQRVVGCRI